MHKGHRSVRGIDEEMLGETQEELPQKALALASEDAGERLRAMGDLAKQGDASVRDLAKAIEIGDRTVRLSATHTLGKIGTPESADALIKTLKHRDPDVRYQALEALEKMKEARAVEPIVRALKDKAPPVRAKAAEALGALGDETAVAPLRRLVNDPDVRTRRHAIRAIEKLTGTKLTTYRRNGKIKLRRRRKSDPKPPAWMWVDD